jgi:UDP-glucuronate 4-epimerase
VPEVERRQIQPGDVLRTCADVSKAYQIFGYESRWRFREGVREFLRWMGPPR